MAEGSQPKLLKDLRVMDLKSELEKRGLATSGVKAVLAERLQKHLEEQGHSVDTFNFDAGDNEGEEQQQTSDEPDEIPNTQDEPMEVAATDEKVTENADEASEADGEGEEVEIKDQAAAEVEKVEEQPVAAAPAEEEEEAAPEGNAKEEEMDVKEDEEVAKEDDEAVQEDEEVAKEEEKTANDDDDDERTAGDDDTVAANDEKVTPDAEDDGDMVTDQQKEQPEEDSINLMLGEEDAMFDEEKDKVNGEKSSKASDGKADPKSPPRPETAPVVAPFTSKDTLDMGAKRQAKNTAMSDNNSMLVNIDESESVGTQGSGKGEPSKDEDSNNKDAAVKKEDGKVFEEKKLRAFDGVQDGLCWRHTRYGETSWRCEAKNECKLADKVTDAPADVKESKSGASVWVSGLSSTTRATDLKSTFSMFGKVIAAKVVTSARTPGAKCYGYVNLATAEEAEKCIKELNKTELHGKTIYVEKSKNEGGGPMRRDPKQTDPAKDGVSKDGDEGQNREESYERRATEGYKQYKQPQGISKRADGTYRPGRRERDTEKISTSDLRGRISGNRRSRSPLTGRSHHHDRRPGYPARADGDREAWRERRGGERDMSPRREDKGQPGILTFDQIRDQQRREKERDAERRRRERERERVMEDDRRRKQHEDDKRRAEEERLHREREDLRREREKLEREKAKILEFERERQLIERNRLAQEKAELERLRRQQTLRLAEERQRSTGATKRPFDDHHSSSRDPYYDERKRSMPTASASSSGGVGNRYDRYETSRPTDSRSMNNDRSNDRARGGYSASSGGNKEYRSDRDHRGGHSSHGGGRSSDYTSSYTSRPLQLPHAGNAGGMGDSYRQGAGGSGGPRAPQPPILSGPLSGYGSGGTLAGVAFPGGSSQPQRPPMPMPQDRFDAYKSQMLDGQKRY